MPGAHGIAEQRSARRRLPRPTHIHKCTHWHTHTPGAAWCMLSGSPSCRRSACPAGPAAAPAGATPGQHQAGCPAACRRGRQEGGWQARKAGKLAGRQGSQRAADAAIFIQWHHRSLSRPQQQAERAGLRTRASPGGTAGGAGLPPPDTLAGWAQSRPHQRHGSQPQYPAEDAWGGVMCGGGGESLGLTGGPPGSSRQQYSGGSRRHIRRSRAGTAGLPPTPPKHLAEALPRRGITPHTAGRHSRHCSEQPNLQRLSRKWQARRAEQAQHAQQAQHAGQRTLQRLSRKRHCTTHSRRTMQGRDFHPPCTDCPGRMRRSARLCRRRCRGGTVPQTPRGTLAGSCRGCSWPARVVVKQRQVGFDERDMRGMGRGGVGWGGAC